MPHPKSSNLLVLAQVRLQLNRLSSLTYHKPTYTCHIFPIAQRCLIQAPAPCPLSYPHLNHYHPRPWFIPAPASSVILITAYHSLSWLISTQFSPQKPRLGRYSLWGQTYLTKPASRNKTNSKVKPQPHFEFSFIVNVHPKPKTRIQARS